jgi:hypothetical protein
LFSFSDLLDKGSDVCGVVTSCLAEVGTAAEAGVITSAAVVGAGVGGAVGAGAAVVTSRALGGREQLRATLCPLRSE